METPLRAVAVASRLRSYSQLSDEPSPDSSAGDGSTPDKTVSWDQLSPDGLLPSMSQLDGIAPGTWIHAPPRT